MAESAGKNIGRILDTEISTEMQKSYLDYAMSVIVARALPDVRDGLKPVHRRIIYAMDKMGLTHSAKYSKTAKVVGEVLGKYHPHGDQAVYDTLVRLAQEFSLRYPLIDGQGNFGSIDGDPAAAMRYTECRLAKITDEMTADIDSETVDYVDNFDATLKEPEVLPAKLPNLLLMGSEGIAVGMATKIPPHNLTEVIDAVNFLITKTKVETDKITGKKTFDNEVTLEELMEYIKGPDFPTGGSIYNIKEIQAAYQTGKGRIVERGVAKIEEMSGGKNAIIISELPYQVNKSVLVAKIADLVREKKLEGISDLRDESDRHGIRVVIELKRDSRPKQVLNNLFEHTALQTTFSVNMVALVDGTPQTLSLKTILEEYVKHRHLVITRRTEFELRSAKARLHILEGLKIALDHLDAVIKTIRESKNGEEAKTNLMTRFKLSEIQAVAILDMQLRKLAALERQKIEDEYNATLKIIQGLEDLLAHPTKILGVITTELNEIKEKYGDERKTKVFKMDLKDFNEEDLIPNEETIVMLTKTGYIKRISPKTYKIQGKGGKGVTGMTTKDDDEVSFLISAETHDNILFFTNKGKVYQIRTWDVPEATRQAKGQAIINLINIEQDERIQASVNFNPKNKENYKYIFLATEKGTVKKTSLDHFQNIRTTGLIAIKLESGDELSWAKLTTGSNHIFLASFEGKSIRFHEKEVRPTERDTMGVRGILLKTNDYVISTDVIDPENKNTLILTATENGKGKKTKVGEWKLQARGGSGIKSAEITAKTGKVVSCSIVPDATENILLTSKYAQIIKMEIAKIPTMSRTTTGVILMRFAKTGDKLAAITYI
jgi:DNA gyrase subunit A